MFLVVFDDTVMAMVCREDFRALQYLWMSLCYMNFYTWRCLYTGWCELYIHSFREVSPMCVFYLLLIRMGCREGDWSRSFFMIWNNFYFIFTLFLWTYTQWILMTFPDQVILSGKENDRPIFSTFINWKEKNRGNLNKKILWPFLRNNTPDACRQWIQSKNSYIITWVDSLSYFCFTLLHSSSSYLFLWLCDRRKTSFVSIVSKYPKLSTWRSCVN